MFAVHFGVVPACFGMMVFGMAGVSVGGMGMMRRLLVIAGLVVLRRFTMMLGRVLMMLGGFPMMFGALFRHVNPFS